MSRGPAAACLLLLATGCVFPGPGPPWQSLFDGRTLAGWEVVEFGGEGPVEVRDGRIELGFGSPLTGIRWAGTLPASGYELELTAVRLEGSDFFCGLTFPVGGSHLTLVLGGWGGALVGLSCLDGLDAAHNETRQFRTFLRNRPYRIRLLVAGRRVAAWLDGAPLLDLDLAGRELALRSEVLPCQPLGIASYATRAGLWDLRWRPR